MLVNYNYKMNFDEYISRKDGYVLEGWYEDKELTKPIKAHNVTEDITVYAKWTKESGRGGKGNKPSVFIDEHMAYIIGREDGLVHPEDNITRAEIAAIFARLLKDEVKAKYDKDKNSFEDVNEQDWFNEYVSVLANAGILKGRDDYSFAPNDNITRAEFAAVAARFSDANADGKKRFSDISGHWAENEINCAATLGWVIGEGGKFRPDEFLTRAEAMTLINRVLEREPENRDDLLDDMITFSDNSDENVWYYLAVQEAVNDHDYIIKDNGYEKWIGLDNKYIITFETNGGTFISTITAKYNHNINFDEYISRKKGYVLEGWYEDKELTKKINTYNVTDDITVYANWVIGTSNKPDVFINEHKAYMIGREDGLVHPEDNITRAEIAAIFTRLLKEDVRAEYNSDENFFEDVNEKDWFNEYVSVLANAGILKGRDDNNFAPNDNITRAEFAAVAVRFSDAEADGRKRFTDISGHWAEDEINRAATLGWVIGEGGKFRPDDFLTRAEAVTLINRILEREPENTDDLLENMITFSDNSDEDMWYYLAVQEAVNDHDHEIKDNGYEKWTKLNNE